MLTVDAEVGVVLTSLDTFTGLGIGLVPDDPEDDPGDPEDDPRSELKMELELKEPLLDPEAPVSVVSVATPTAATGTETTVMPGPLLTGQVHWHVPVLASAVVGLLMEAEAITVLALSPAVAVVVKQFHTRRSQCNGHQMDAGRSVPD